MTTQRKLPFSRSLEGDNQQIKINMLHVEHRRTKMSHADIVKYNTGLTVSEYLERPFNRLMYQEYKRQLNKWKTPKLNFWQL